MEPRDVTAVVAMVHELAAYEKAPEDCHLTEQQLVEALFRPDPALFGHIAIGADGEPVGIALWYLTFSTWTGVHGIYLEDLYVRPAERGTGAGKALVATLARTCVDRGYERLEWVVLDWNPALRFYAALGARIRQGWLAHRLDGAALHSLGTAESVGATGF